jgi:glycosyltransferase involved in cell wall biosynthesis
MKDQPSALPRVLMAVPQYPYPVVGGLERQAHELAKALLERGIDVQAVSGRTDPGQPAHERVEGVLVHRIPWNPEKRKRFFRSPADLCRVLFARRHSYDVIHIHQLSWFSLFVIAIARMLNKPVLAKLSGINQYGLPGLASSRLGTLKMAVFAQVQAVVAMSEESLNELRAVGFPIDNVLVTPNGIRMLTECVHVPKGGTEQETCRVVFVGRISEEKLLKVLLRAWRRIVESASATVTLELWGSGPAESELMILCRSLGIQDSVIFRGHVKAVREKLRDMDVFVLPSLTEGNSNAILEAMAAGLPIVSTRVGGTPMQVGPEGARYLVAPADEDGLYSRLIELIEDRSLRERVGAAMHQRILTFFDITRVAETYAAAYALIAAGRADQLAGIANPVIAAQRAEVAAVFRTRV